MRIDSSFNENDDEENESEVASVYSFELEQNISSSQKDNECAIDDGQSLNFAGQLEGQIQSQVSELFTQESEELDSTQYNSDDHYVDKDIEI